MSDKPNFIDKTLKDDLERGDPKAKIIKVAVDLYIASAEKTKAELETQLAVEAHKNVEVKKLAEQLARELLRLSPGHTLAETTLALLLENKMRQSGPRRKGR